MLYINFEGLNIETVQEAQQLADFFERKLADKKVHAITNYDNFNLNPAAAHTFFDMVKRNHEHFLSYTRYSTNAFFRRQLGKQFTQASLENSFYKDFDEAKKHL